MKTLKQPKILIVDDEKPFCEALSKILATENYDITTVNTGNQAIELLYQKEFEIVLLDLVLPDISGIDLLKHIKSVSPVTEIIVLSAYGSLETVIKALNEEAFSFVTKPINNEILLDTISRALKKQNITLNTKRIVRNLFTINSILKIVGHAVSLPEFLDTCLAEIVRQTKSNGGAIILCNEKENKLYLAAHNNLAEPIIQELADKKMLDLQTSDAVTVRVFKSGIPEIISTDEVPSVGLRELLVRYDRNSFVLIPIKNKKETIGVLVLLSSTPHYFTNNDLALLTNLSRHLAIGIEKAMMFDEILHNKDELSFVFESIPEMVMLLDAKHNILWANKMFINVFNISIEELTGKKCYHIVHNKDESIENCPLEKSLQSESKVIEEITAPDGKIYQLSCYPIKDSSGEITKIIHLSKDVTDYWRMQQQMINSDRLVALGELISGVSHELNNPLTTIIGYAKLLMGVNMPAELKEDIKKIYEASIRSQRIVQNLLSFARQHKIESQPINLNEIITNVVNILKYQLQVNNINIILQLDTNLPKTMADFYQMEQVFINLLTNAKQSIEEKQQPGEIRIVATLQNNDFIKILVSDSGCGISAENANKIFDPFFTTKEVGRGTGLGLSICHGIISNYQGKIYVEKTEPGIGTTIGIEMPITKETVEKQGNVSF